MYVQYITSLTPFFRKSRYKHIYRSIWNYLFRTKMAGCCQFGFLAGIRPHFFRGGQPLCLFLEKEEKELPRTYDL